MTGSSGFFPAETARRLGHLLGAAASVGMVVGFGSALEEVVLQRYVSLGYYRNTFQTLLGGATRGTLVGAATAVALLLLWLILRYLIPGLRRESGASFLLRVSRHPLVGIRAFAALQTVALAFLLVIAWRYETVVLTVILGVVAALVAFGVALALARRLAERATDSDRGSSAATILALFATVAFLIVRGITSNRAFAFHPFSSDSLLANSMLLVYGALTFVIVRAAVLPGETTPRHERPWSSGLLRAHFVPLHLFVLLWLLSPLLDRPSLSVDSPKNVLVIGIDTLRLDDTSLGQAAPGSPAPTPNLERLAEQSVTFSAAMSQAPWTLPAFASVMTGSYPPEHGAISLAGFLRKKEVVLAETLREAGYRTAAVVSHVFVSSERGFDQGFDFFDESNVLGHEAVTGSDVTDLALEYVSRRDRRPFFLFVHYFDPHYEYRDHQQWDFADGYSGWLKGNRRQKNIDSLRMKRHLLDPDDVSYLRDLYREEIAFTDLQIGRLLDHLREEDLLADTVIAVVADHGEEFLEHGWLGHTISLHEEVVRVPFLLHLPGVEPTDGKIETVVETRSLFATILDYLGLPLSVRQGQDSLLPLVGSRQQDLPGRTAMRPVFSSVWLPDAPVSTGKRVKLTAVRLGDWKLIRDQLRSEESLFHLGDDPAEQTDLIGEEHPMADRLRKHLAAWLSRMEAEEPSPDLELSPEEIEALEALGYL